jgi:hypothetical protein
LLNAVDFNYFGKPRHLKFDINAIADVEREIGIGVNSIMSQERMGLDILRVLLWAGLRHEDQSLTPYKIGNWIQKYLVDNKSNIIEAMNKFQGSILEAFRLSDLFGSFEEQPEEPEVKNPIAEEA